MHETKDPHHHQPGDRGLYAILDVLTGDFIGNILIFRSEAQALRFFKDVLAAENTAVHAHPEDHVLVRLGLLDQDNNLVPARNAVMQGSQLVALATSSSAADETATERHPGIKRIG